MATFRVRPRIRRESPKSVEKTIAPFKKTFDEGDENVFGTIVQHHMIFKIRQKDQHFWSPELHLSVDDYDGTTLVRGYIGPKSTVWTMFIFMYILVGVLALFSLMIGLSNWSLDIPTNAFWYSGGAILLFVLLFIAAQIGQKIGYEQTEVLMNFFNKIFEKIN